MGNMKEEGGAQDLIERQTLCLSSTNPGIATHSGHSGFRESISRHFDVAESNAAEKLVELKMKLRDADTEEFWTALMEGMTSITGAQYGFVAKRILIDDEDTAIEMPMIGQPGSCLLGVAFYYNDGDKIKNLHRDYKYLAFGAPCAHMRHDKVFLIPERLNEFITNNPNNFPFPTDAYLGVPLFSEGKCFAHFGMMWSAEGLTKRSLGWGYMEMLLHSLEDTILQRVLEGQSFAKPVESNKKVIPQEAVTASQSLKPYARSLSHELRTPMQGVVGMLDVMHATVQESLEGQSNPKLREIFQILRENIEVVQDSSRRAVEAADNVVHAYDLNMQVPDTPVPPIEEESVEAQSSTSTCEKRPNILIEGNNIPINPNKRRRSASFEWSYAPVAKHRAVPSTISTPGREISPGTGDLKYAVQEGDNAGLMPQIVPIGGIVEHATQRNASVSEIDESAATLEQDSVPTPGHRHTKLRELVHLIVNESLRVGGRPESAIAEDTERGEIIEVRSRSSKGEASTKMIEWSVDPSVPEILSVDERDLAKLISCVFLNAVKFTERGNINVTATLSPKSRFLVISIKDTGPGIPQDFLPNLFKPFSREDDSLTRQKEGLGLGLLVAKGLVRKMGGDLVCVRSNTTGPNRGSEFELRVPIAAQDSSNSRPSTPIATRTPTPSTLLSLFPSDAPAMSTPRNRQTSTTTSTPLDRRRTLGSNPTAGNSKSPDPQPPPFTKASSPLLPASPSRHNSTVPATTPRRGSTKRLEFDRHLALKHPLTFLVVEDNKINRKLLVNMLMKLGYKPSQILEAFDGAEAVRQMSLDHVQPVNVVLMDLWMPGMDGYEATEKILAMSKQQPSDEDGIGGGEKKGKVTVLAVSADVTEEALERAANVGMEGFMTKPFKLLDLERLIVEYCARNG